MYRTVTVCDCGSSYVAWVAPPLPLTDAYGLACSPRSPPWGGCGLQPHSHPVGMRIHSRPPLPVGAVACSPVSLCVGDVSRNSTGAPHGLNSQVGSVPRWAS